MGTGIRGVVAAAAVVFGFASIAAAQPRLQGVVHDHNGNPLPGVVVTVEHPEQTAVRVVVTDLKGTYTVGEVEQETEYKVRVSHPRYRKTRLTATPGYRLDVTLKPRRLPFRR